MSGFTESVLEEAARAWLECVSWQICSGAEIVSGEPAAKRDDCGRVVLAERLCESLLLPASGDLRLKDVEKFTARVT